MMKKVSFILLCLLFIFTMAAAGCNTNQPAQAPPAVEDPEQEVAPADPDKVFTLIYSDFAAENDDSGKIAAQAAARIEEESDGRIKMETHFGGSLLAPDDVFAGLTTGAADIVRFSSSMFNDGLDMNRIYNRFFETASPDITSLSVIYNEVLTKIPEVQQEMEEAGARWLAIRALPGNNLHTADKVARVPDDIKGMKILAAGEGSAYIETVGGAAIDMQQPDYYMSLEKGLADGELSGWSEISSDNRLKVLKYHIFFGKNGIEANAAGYLINLNAWNNLPADLQKLVAEVYKWAAGEEERLDLENKAKIEAEALENGNTFIQLTPEELQLWQEYAKPVNDQWIQETEAKGLPAQKAFDEFMNLLK